MNKYYLDKLLIATGNQGKYREYQGFLKELNVNLRSLSGFDIEEPEETEGTFSGNAILKAKYYFKKTGLACISDDSGLCIPILDGMPGVYSARWAGPTKDFNIAMQKVYDQLLLRGVVPEEDIIPAYFYCAIALKIASNEEYIFEGRVDGGINFPGSGEAGFGYDPIFYPKGSTLRFSEMGSVEKSKTSHRGDAVAKLVSFLHENVAL